MRVARHMLLLVLAFLIQTTWVEALAVAALKPDLILLALVQVALRTGPTAGALYGFGVGFLQDTLMPVDLGLNACIMALLGYGAGYCRSGMAADSIQVQVAVVLGSVLVHDLVFYAGSSGVQWLDVPRFWLRFSVGRAVYTCLVSAVLYASLVFRSRFSPAGEQ